MNTNQFEDWTALQSFQNVISKFQHRYFSSGTLKARDYRLSLQPYTPVRASCIITPSAGDLAADINSAIRAGVQNGTTTERQVNYFRRYYASGHVPRVAVLTHDEVKEAGCDKELEDHIERFRADLQDSVRQIDGKVRTAIGKALIAKGVAPIEQYLHPVDTRKLKAERLQAGKLQAKRTAEFITMRVAVAKEVAA